MALWFTQLLPSLSVYAFRVTWDGGSVRESVLRVRQNQFRLHSQTLEAVNPTAINVLSPAFMQEKIENIVNSEPVRILSNDSVLAALKSMNSANKGAILVMNCSNSVQLIGIFTERDFTTKLLDVGKLSNETCIADVMSVNVITASKSQSLCECRNLMLKHNIRHLPIMNDVGSTAMGLVSMRDIIKSLREEDLLRGSARFAGNTLKQVEEQAKSEANLIALAGGEAKSKQDTLRTVFVVVCAIIGALLLQGNWIYAHNKLAMIITFIVGYVGIIFETYFEFNKGSIALLMSTALWIIFAGSQAMIGANSLPILSEKIAEVSEVIFFILGAMTIVELVDAHQGFKLITNRIRAKNMNQLFWIIGLVTFFLSAFLDNLTTTIIMVSLVRKLIPNTELRKLFGGMIVVAANAGGAWTPIGDVTTTMMWIHGQISAIPTITNLLLPSLASVLVTMGLLQRQVGDVNISQDISTKDSATMKLAPRGSLVFLTGTLGLLSVPAFKAVTGLPPYLGMLAALGVMWSLTDAIHAGEEDRQQFTAPAALRKIDTSGVLFFLGILLSVGALDAAGILRNVAEMISQRISSDSLIAGIIGVVSSVIDNVPLVAATMGMYDLSKVPTDSPLWQQIAYCAGTGGSLLVIGSAAGVALLGLEKVDFLWYVRKISFSALVGYLAGIAVYIAQRACL